MKRKLRIGILSDSPFLTTGFCTISTNIANILVDAGHEVIYFGSNYIGQPVMPGATFEDGKKLKFMVIGGGREAYFKDLLSSYCKVYKLDILFCLLDTFMVYPWYAQMDFSPAKTIFYYPSDGGGGMPLGCELILKSVNVAVAMAQFGQKQVEKVHGFKTEYIPHAIDTSLYKPLSKEEKLNIRRAFGIPDNAFVVGSVFRNQGRKMADRTIKAFALFAKDNPDAILFLHTDPDDAAQVFPIQHLIARYGIQNRVIFSGMKFFKGFDYRRMNDVYNVMDIFLLTTSGEGFGVPIIEAMACEIPVVCTDYTTTRELIVRTNAGLAINLAGDTPEENPDVHGHELLDGTIVGSWMVDRGICSIKDCSAKMQKLKDDIDLRITLGRNGRKAVLKEYSWDVVGPQWVELVEKLGGQY